MDRRPRLTNRPYVVLRHPGLAQQQPWTIAVFTDHPPPNLRGNSREVRRDSRARTLKAIRQVRQRHRPDTVILAMDANTTSPAELAQVSQSGLRNVLGQRGYKAIDQIWVGGTPIKASGRYRCEGMERITDHRTMVVVTLTHPNPS